MKCPSCSKQLRVIYTDRVTPKSTIRNYRCTKCKVEAKGHESIDFYEIRNENTNQLELFVIDT